MFVYRITDIKNKKYYYGSKIAKNSNFNQMGKTYFSSSKNKEFIIDQKDNPENFKYKLVKYFKTAEDTIKYESKLHFKFNVKSNNKFYNMSNQTTDGVKFFNGKITCPFCEQNVNLGNYERWHGENCRVLDESKTFFDRMHYFPYMKLLRNKETLKLEWINTKFFLYDDSLYTTDLKNQRTKIKTEEGYITINTSELTNDCILINSKEWVILNKNNEIVHRNYSIKKLSYIIKYMTLLYSTNSTKSSVTFLHERAQLNRAVSEDLLKFEGWKMMTIEEYNDKEYDIYDKNRINKILSGRNNYKFLYMMLIILL
jgi:hypothetical protein